MKTKKPQLERIALAAFAVATSATLPAAVKYWDSPAFRAYDVGDYAAKESLVVNYDGIRNAGPDAPHDPAATTWVNSANPGTYDMNRYSLVDGALVAGAAKGYWTATGFVFAKDAVFGTDATEFKVPTSFSHQILVDAKSSDQSGIGYPMCGSAEADSTSSTPQNWNNGIAVGIRSTGTIAHTMYFCPFGAGTSERPAISGTSFTYGTAILDGADAVMFDGISAPWSAAATGGTTGHYKPSSYSPTERTCKYGISLGGHYKRTDELFKGTLKSYRFYNKALSDEEVAWNRVVDEARYFNRRGQIPVTNVVVSVTIDGVEDDHFALDADGYTFTAPATRTVAGKRYALGGYTLETWNGSAWTGATTGSGSSVTLSDASAKVRLTWNYSRPDGEGQLAHYDVSDYVQQDLVLHYDGILNDGIGKPHNPNAGQWQNVAPGYSQWPMDWCSYVPASGGGYQWTRNNHSQGVWTDNGFAFNGYGYFAKWGDTPKFPAPAQFTMQFALEGSFSDLAWGTQYLFLPSTGYGKGSVGLRTSNFTAANGNANSVYMIDTTAFPSARPNFYPTDKKLTYANFVIDSETGHAFEGTAPTDATTANVAVSASPARDLSWFSFGGFHDKATTAGTSLECFKGVIHDFRFYNRALEEADLVQNRKVDEYRYYGRYIVTNILVQSTYSYLQGNEADGPYEVVGSFTFTAPESVTAENGITYEPDGYVVETWDAAFGWKDATAGTGNAYLYKTSYGLQRLTWKWKAVKGLRTAADYGFDDLSPAGLELHYDSVFNAGAGAARSTTASKWVNLGAAGASMDLNLSRKSGDTSAWGAEKGYDFAGYAYFNSPVKYLWGGSFTAQALVDAKHADNKHGSGNYIAASSWNRFGMQDYGPGKKARFNVQGTDASTVYRAEYATADGVDYMTVVEDIDAKVDLAFAGVRKPTDGTASTGYRTYTTQLDRYENNFRLGSYGGGNDGLGLNGTIYAFRYYDRVLTDEELERNRNVDAARYFGELGVTNVVVSAPKYGSGQTEAAGAYYVEGAWTFKAQNVKADGATREITGCRIDAIENGAVVSSAFHFGSDWTYDKAENPPATVRLTWRWRTAGMTVIIR